LSKLPITIEGYLGNDNQEVDRDEYGRIVENFYYLGCPNLDSEHKLGWYGQPRFIYDVEKDITDILQNNLGKYIRITIEAVEIGGRAECEVCKRRFECLTKIK